MNTAEALDTLMNEISAALADVVQAMQAGQESQSEIATSLVELVQLMEARKTATPITELVDAIKAIRITAPDVTVNVSPTPINMAAPVVQVIERATPGEYEMRFTYDHLDRLQTARLVPVSAKDKAPEPAGPRVIWPGDQKTVAA